MQLRVQLLLLLLFFLALWVRLAGRSVQSYEKWSFFSVFSRLGQFLQVFGQVKEFLILGLGEIIRVLHLVGCPMDFDLLCDLGQQREVLKRMKNDYF